MAKIITAFPVNKPDSSGHWIIEGVSEAGHIHLDNIDERGIHAGSPEQHLYDAVKKNKPDLVIITKTKVFEPVLKEIKCKKVIINVDCRVSVSSWAELFPSIRLVDAYFPCEYHLIDSYKKLFGDKVYFLPTACGKINKRIDPDSLPRYEVEKYKSDIAFIGSRDDFHGISRERIISAIERKYKDGFKWYGPGSPNGYAGNDEFNKICSFSKIILGNNYLEGLDSYVSRRDFMVLGSGGFLLSNLWKNTKRVMIPGEHFTSYKGIDDCLYKIDRYLGHDYLRKRIADKGYRYAHEECRWKNRIQTICKTMGLK